MQNPSCRGIIIKDKKILLIQRVRYNSKYYTIPGGTIEKGETKEETLIREIKEETNCEVEIEKYLFSTKSKESGKINYFFECKFISGVPELRTDSVEFTRQNKNNKYNPDWLTLDNIYKIKLFPTEVKDYLLRNYILK